MSLACYGHAKDASHLPKKHAKYHVSFFTKKKLSDFVHMSAFAISLHIVVVAVGPRLLAGLTNGFVGCWAGIESEGGQDRPGVLGFGDAGSHKAAGRLKWAGSVCMIPCLWRIRVLFYDGMCESLGARVVAVLSTHHGYMRESRLT